MNTILKRIFSTTGLVVALILFLAVNVLSQNALRSARLDLTEERLYTLSPGTRNILASLDEPVTIRLFISESLLNNVPILKSYAMRVRELLEEYVSLSGGKLRLEIIDPRPFTEEEDRAVQLGLQGIPVPSSGELIYFGVAGTNSTDDQSVIPFLVPDREDFLEYDLSKLIFELANPRKPVVGVMSALNMDGAPAPMFGQRRGREPWVILEQLRQLFDVRMIPVETRAIEPDVDVLMVVHPKQLSEDTEYAIDQFVLRGGRALFFVDPFAQADEPPQDPNNPMTILTADRFSTLTRIFPAWGIEMNAEQVAADRERAQPVNMGSNVRPEIVNFVAWLGLTKDELDGRDVITSQLQSINMAAAGALSVTEESTLTMKPLVQTTADSMLIDRSSIQVFPNPRTLLDSFKSREESLVLAARFEGRVNTAFPDGPPWAARVPEDDEQAQAEATAAREAHLQVSTNAVSLVVVADVDMLTDDQWVRAIPLFGSRIHQPFADNGSLVVNAVDNLTGNEDLISVRSRGRFRRPFVAMERLRTEAEEQHNKKVQELQTKLREAEQRINSLRGETNARGGVILSDEQLAELDRVREEQLRTRRELRDVQAQLRANVEQLGNRVSLINMALVPLLMPLPLYVPGALTLMLLAGAGWLVASGSLAAIFPTTGGLALAALVAIGLMAFDILRLSRWFLRR